MSKKSFADLTDQDRALFSGAATRLINCIPCGYAGLCPVTRSIRNWIKLIWVVPTSVIVGGILGGFGFASFAFESTQGKYDRVSQADAVGASFVAGAIVGTAVMIFLLWPKAKKFVLCPSCRNELGPIE